MNARFILIAAAALMSASALAAEPCEGSCAEPPAQPQHQPQPQVVLASAEDAHAPTPADQQSPTPPKRRIARVTTCRCGDQQAQPEQ